MHRATYGLGLVDDQNRQALARKFDCSGKACKARTDD
jgi:hypothetical protein